jgi:NADH-quinone oxidoreductase subunit M
MLAPSIVIIPILTALIILLVQSNNKMLIRLLAFSAAISTSILTAVMLIQFQPETGIQHTFSVPWIPFLGINFTLGFDGISIPFLALTAILAPVGLLYSTGITRQVKEYFVLYLVLIGGAYGLFLSQNLFFIFFFLEFEVLTAYFLISLWRRGFQENRERNAFQFLLFSSLAGLLFLIFVALIFVNSGMGSLELSDVKNYLATASSGNTVLFSLLLGCSAILSALFPFHAWGPLGYSIASRGVNTFLAGVMKKVGPYLLIRLGLELFPIEMRQFAPYIIPLCLMNIIYVAWVAMAQRDPKLMAGFSGSSHMGYILLGIFSMSQVGLMGSLVLCFGSGLVSALIFTSVGRLEEQVGPFQFGKISGMGVKTPFLYFVFCAAAFAGVGLPGFANFAGEIMVLFSLVDGNKIVLAVAIGGALLSAVYLLRAIKSLFQGKLISSQPIEDEKWIGKLASIIVLIGLVAIGTFPKSLTDPLAHDVKNALQYTERVNHE